MMSIINSKQSMLILLVFVLRVMINHLKSLSLCSLTLLSQRPNHPYIICIIVLNKMEKWGIYYVTILYEKKQSHACSWTDQNEHVCTYIHDVSKYDRVVQQNIFVNGNLDVKLILKMMNTYLW